MEKMEDLNDEVQRFEINTRSPIVEVTLHFEPDENARPFMMNTCEICCKENQMVERIRIYTEDGEVMSL